MRCTHRPQDRGERVSISENWSCQRQSHALAYLTQSKVKLHIREQQRAYEKSGFQTRSAQSSTSRREQIKRGSVFFGDSKPEYELQAIWPVYRIDMNFRRKVMSLSEITTKKVSSSKSGAPRGQKRPLRPREVWAIRARLEMLGNVRNLALLNLAIDSKLRGCDLVRLKVSDVSSAGSIRERAMIIQKKT